MQPWFGVPYDLLLHFPPMPSTPAFSTPAFSTHAINSCFFHSCIFHPCHLLLLFPLLHFPLLLSTPAFSNPAFSTLAILTVSHFPLPHFQSPPYITEHFLLHCTALHYVLSFPRQRPSKQNIKVRIPKSPRISEDIHTDSDLLGGIRKGKSGERRRQVFRVHLHTRTSQVVVLPLRHLRRLTKQHLVYERG